MKTIEGCPSRMAAVCQWKEHKNDNDMCDRLAHVLLSAANPQMCSCVRFRTMGILIIAY